MASLALFSLTISCHAGAVFNINKYNGLSSNHVYCTLVDEYGYLWISTTDGVFRYNGYTFTKYDYKDGLPNVDVWNMYQDKQHRIWLLSIANGIGYIKNQRFHPIHVPDSLPYKIYPSTPVELDSSIVFLNKLSGDYYSLFYSIKNDSLHFKNFECNSFTSRPYLLNDKFIIAYDSILNIFDLRDILYNAGLNTIKPLVQKKPTIRHMNDYSGFTIYSVFGDQNHYNTNPKSKLALFYNPFSNKADTISIADDAYPDEGIAHVHPLKGRLNILTNYKVLEIDKELNVINKYPYRRYFNSATPFSYSATYFIYDEPWGYCIATSDNGLYINSGTSEVFDSCAINLNGYRYVNAINDSSAFWWNESANTLATVTNGAIQDSFILNDVFNIKNIIPYDNERSLMFSGKNLKWLYKDGTERDIISETDSLYYNNIKRHLDEHYQYMFYTAASGVALNDSLYYILGSGWLGLVRIQMHISKKKIVSENISNTRFDDIIKYPYLNSLICYSNDKILFYRPDTDDKIIISAQLLKNIGIHNIEKIATDIYGNIFIKDYTQLYVYNPIQKSIRPVLTNYNLNGAVINVKDSTLTVAGSFGIAKCHSDASGKLSDVTAYVNTKNLYYRYLYDVQFSADHVLLKTDAGNYSVNMNNTENSSYKKDWYNIVLNYEGSSTLHNMDTVHISQNVNKIGIDIVKPTGTGNLNITYAINNSTYNSTGKQIILPNLKYGSYNEVSIIASDESWRSSPTMFYIYIEPYWWQQAGVRNTLYALLILAIAGLAYIIIRLTQRVVNEANSRRNQRRELELKSIYSQINPHFIFNTLSTAQYFVKKNKNREAYDHISQFSDLLRAYIKSSRNKYISIADEVDNLENYLQLQLSRFERKFDYNIDVDNTLDIQKVMLPSLLLQPLVENALNHGIFHLDGKGKLTVSFKQNKSEKDTLTCVVEDNGVGRKRSKELRSDVLRKADSYGTILIKELVDTFNKYEHISIFLEYIDKEYPESGTIVIIHIKNYTHA